MSNADLLVLEDPMATYVSAEEHELHAKISRLSAKYHEASAKAVTARLRGDIATAQKYGQEVDAAAEQIEALLAT